MSEVVGLLPAAEVTEETLTLDGAETKSAPQGQGRVSSARLSADGRQLEMQSVMAFAWGPPGSKLTVRDAWTFNATGDVLTIQRTSTMPMGEQKKTLAFDGR